MRTFDRKKIIRFFTWKRLLFPIIIGAGVAIWLIINDLETGIFDEYKLGYKSLTFFTIAALLQVLRDFFYMLRLRILTEKQLTWKQSFEVIMLWEFASALTPSVVGGSAVAFFIIAQEGISLGRSTAIVLITAFFDELFYLLMVPAILLFINLETLFGTEQYTTLLGVIINFKTLFYIGYLFIFLLIVVITYGVFINPFVLKKILVSISHWRFFRKRQAYFEKIGDDIMTTSQDMKQKPFIFWCKVFGITFFSWTARFLVINFLIIGAWFLKYDSISSISIMDIGSQLLIYAKQFIMWIILMINPMPGGSGVAEFVFCGFLASFIPHGLASLLAIFWRCLSYYIYLVMGIIVFPIWLRRVFSRKHLNKIRKTDS